MKDRAQRLYGQSWSLTRDSDAMWRIYSKNNMSVRIKSTFGKMMKLMNLTRAFTFTGSCFGRVKYVDQKELDLWLKNVEKLGWGKSLRKPAESLFLKRKPFAHENEIRFIIYEDKLDVEGNSRSIKDAYFLEFDPLKIIEEIAIDPRLDVSKAKEQTSQLKSIVGENLPIIQSTLYSFSIHNLSFKTEPLVLDI